MGACNACGAKGQDELAEFSIDAATKGDSNAVKSPTGGNKDPAAAAAKGKSPKKGDRTRDLSEEEEQQPQEEQQQPQQQAPAGEQPEPAPEQSPEAAQALAAEESAPAPVEEQSPPAAQAPAAQESATAPVEEQSPAAAQAAAAKESAPAPAEEQREAAEEAQQLAVHFAKLPSVGVWLAPRPPSSWLAALAAAQVVGAKDAVADAGILGGEVLAMDESPSKLDAQLAAKCAAPLGEDLIGEPKALEEVHSTEQCAVLFEDNVDKAQVAEAAPEADEILSDPIKKDELASVAPTKRPWSRLPSVGTWVSGAYHPILLRDAAVLQELSSTGAKAEA